jgi:hypothetical protein
MKMLFGLVVALVFIGTMLPAGAVSQRGMQLQAQTRSTATDFSASRRRHGRARHATRVYIYRRGDYSFFEPYAPPVPPFFPFGYQQGYF